MKINLLFSGKQMLLLGISWALVACQPDPFGAGQNPADGELLTFTPKSASLLKAQIAQATALIEEALLDKDARMELLHAIRSGYYLDEMVFLRDLLDARAPLHAHEPFTAHNPHRWAFKQAYEKRWRAKGEQVGGPAWFDDNLTIYFPYSETFLAQADDLADWAILGAALDGNASPAKRYSPAGYEAQVQADDAYAAAQPLLVVGVNQTAQDA
jgi:hypothetical protein